MAHISRMRRKKFDEGKYRRAQKEILKDHFDRQHQAINATRRATAAEARKDFDSYKSGQTKGMKPLGTFSWDEVIYCQLRYGPEITRDPDFWKFYRKANDQSFLNFA